MGKVLRYWIFDLDNTLYPPSSGLFDVIDRRINRYLEVFFGVPPDEADSVRREYFEKYGLTMVGLMQERNVRPEHYLRYVHDIPVESYLRPNPSLRVLLDSIPSAKVIFTNGSRDHSEAVVRALGIQRSFEEIFDIASVGYVPKPDPRSYREVLQRLGIEGSQAVLVEDLPRNLRPAKELGLKTILVGGGESADADFTVPAAEDLGSVLPLLGY